MSTPSSNVLRLCVLDFISDFDGGTVRLEKMGSVGAENWVVTFSVGYSRKEFIGEGTSLEQAMVGAVQKWPEGLAAWKKRTAFLGRA